MNKITLVVICLFPGILLAKDAPQPGPHVLTDPQNGALNPLGVNCLRAFPVHGIVCWGARTLDGADAQASEEEIHGRGNSARGPRHRLNGVR